MAGHAQVLRGAVCLLQSVALQHKQRHHLIGQFVIAPSEMRAEMHKKRDISPFLLRFYNNQLAQ